MDGCFKELLCALIDLLPKEEREREILCRHIYRVLHKWRERQTEEFADFLQQELQAERSLGFQRFLRCLNGHN